MESWWGEDLVGEEGRREEQQEEEMRSCFIFLFFFRAMFAASQSDWEKWIMIFLFLFLMVLAFFLFCSDILPIFFHFGLTNEWTS